MLLCIICPLVIGGPASALQFWQQDRIRETRVALTLANQKLEKANADLERAFTALREQARRDELTGVLNRGAFLGELKSKLPLMSGTLLFIDADNFKQVNDLHGHPTGDKALQIIAATLSTRIESEDLIGRIGGEEFAIFLAAIEGRDALVVAEAIRTSVRLIKLTTETGHPVDLSISVGAVRTTPESDIDTAWRLADQSLYQAKHMGRNMVILYRGALETGNKPLVAALPIQLAS